MIIPTRTILLCSALVLPACVDPAPASDAELAAEVQDLSTGARCPPVEPTEGGVFNTPFDEGRIAFTADGDTAYFHRADENFTYTIYVSHRVAGGWSTPVPASFSGQPGNDDIDPFITADGTQLWFSSWRGVDGAPNRPDTDLWVVTRQADGSWGPPAHAPAPLNSPYYENYPSIAPDGTLYFNTNRAAPAPDVFDGWDLYTARPTAGGWAPPVQMPDTINTTDWEFNPMLLPGGRVLVFSSIRDTGYGGPDLYASVRLGRSWSPAVNLGPCINTADGEFHPTWSSVRHTLSFIRSTPATQGDHYDVSLGW
ncbi:MAG: hypothetical protein R3B06_01015 [Kofleriaceae bacterium]